MSYMALVQAFASTNQFPVAVGAVLEWIRSHTDHKIIHLHPVSRHKKAYRGACRRRGVSTLTSAYSTDFEIVTEILYGEDLPDEWQRLVICKEALHVFDSVGERVNTPDAVRRLIPSVITPELRGAPFLPAINDHLGAFRAMAVLLPSGARPRLKEAVDCGSRTISDVAQFVKLPDVYVDMWLRWGDELEPLLLSPRV